LKVLQTGTVGKHDTYCERKYGGWKAMVVWTWQICCLSVWEKPLQDC